MKELTKVDMLPNSNVVDFILSNLGDKKKATRSGLLFLCK